MPIQEVRTIPDIRERNDRPKDKQPKHQVTSTIQRQMVQKFVKELSDSAKQPDRSDSAEHTATEQVEAASRAVFHIGRTIQNPRSVCNQSSLRRHTKDRLQHGNAQKTCEPDRTPHRTAHQHQRRKNKDDVPTFSRQQKQRRHRRSRQNRRRNILPH